MAVASPPRVVAPSRVVRRFAPSPRSCDGPAASLHPLPVRASPAKGSPAPGIAMLPAPPSRRPPGAAAGLPGSGMPMPVAASCTAGSAVLGYNLEAHVEALRRERAAVRQRCEETERLIRERTRALRAENLRLAGEEAIVEGRWLDLQAFSPGADSPDVSILETSNVLMSELPEQRAALAEEWQRVHHAMTAADERVRQASDLGREQALFWETRAASFRDAEERWEASLETRLAEHARRSREELASVEARGLERLQEAAVLGDERAHQALAMGQSRTRQCEVLAEAAAQQQAANSPEHQELSLRIRMGTQEAEMRVRLQKAESDAREALKEEALKEEAAWLQQLEMKSEQEALAECLRAEDEAKRHELHVESCCLEERTRLAARDEACTEAWLVYAWAEADAQINEEAAAIREETLVQEEQTAQRAESAEVAREYAHTKQALQNRATHEIACAQGLAAGQTVQEEKTQMEISLLLEERQACEQELAAFRAAQDATWPSQLAAAKAKQEESVTQGFQEALLTSAAREDEFRERLVVAEIEREQASLSAHHLSARSDQMRQEYKLRVDDLLSTTARLEEEKILLAEERRRLLLGQHRATIRSPRPQSPERAFVTSPLVAFLPPGSPSWPAPAANSSAPFSANMSPGAAAWPPALESTAAPFWRTSQPLESTVARAPPVVESLVYRGDEWVARQSLPAGTHERAVQQLHPVLTGGGYGRQEWSQTHSGFSDNAWHTQPYAAPTSNVPFVEVVPPPVASYHSMGSGLSEDLQRQNDTPPMAAADLVYNFAQGNAPSGDVGRHDGNSDVDAQISIPPVYQAAIAMVEHYGWREVHDCGPEWTALHWASSEGRADVCARLLAASGDPFHVDHAGRSALDYAGAAGDETVMSLLAQAAGVSVASLGECPIPADASGALVPAFTHPGMTSESSLAVEVQRESIVEVRVTPSPSFVI